MLFNSYIFIFAFLPVTLCGFFLLGKYTKPFMAIYWLVGASLFFYAWWNPAYLTLLLCSIAFNYTLGTSLGKINDENSLLRKSILTIGVIGDLALIGYFKYANFFVDSLNFATGGEIYLAPIILPLAISFFTFQQITYLVDAYRWETKDYNFLHYCLFVSFFPQLIAGPIVHHREMLPQFEQSKIYSPQSMQISIGLTIFFIGLFKKIVIADNMALLATPVFDAANAGETLTFFTAWQGALAYTFQLYFDFSGYSDMAIGLARMFGIVLPLNFNSPYRADNIIDFWRRWHITLSRFLRDYLYIALGGNRAGKVRRYTNLMITMLLGGLWHGAGWTFVMWGALHGFYLMINHAWRAFFPIKTNHWTLRYTARIVTFIAVVVGWVFFRAESIDAAITVLQGMMNLPATMANIFGPLRTTLEALGFQFNGGYLSSQDLELVGWFVVWMCIVWWWPNTQEIMVNIKPVLENVEPHRGLPTVAHWQPNVIWGILIGGTAVSAILGLTSVTEFLYFQF